MCGRYALHSHPDVVALYFGLSEIPAYAPRSAGAHIPANGFSGWRRGAARRQPYYVRPAEGELFAFAGLWERWQDLETCSIITTEANETGQPIHDRMPVILEKDAQADWLQGKEGLLRPCAPQAIRAHPVGPAVNNAGNESPALIRPLH